jgi:predicted SAM-dependent methyltransferase
MHTPERLEIASGDRPFGGDDWTHHDARALPHIEIVCDNADLANHVEPGSVGELRATHILEHFSWHDTAAVLAGWGHLMRPGGQIYLEVPDGGWQVRAATRGEITFPRFVQLAYGDQDYPGNAHCASFDETLLGARLREAGFAVGSVRSVGMVLVAIALWTGG